ncbi:MAG TPA: hypothetical protein VGF55_05590, partial [Gemmataceae bacterium]
MSWRVGTSREICPLVSHGPRGRVIEESVSDPLPPSDTYVTELVPSGSTDSGTRWAIACPTGSPVLLFQPDGRLLDVEDPDPLPPGRYLGLIRPRADVLTRRLPGVTLADRIVAGPVGWPGWSAWQLELAPSAQVPGYRVAAEHPVLKCELQAPPTSAVRWLETCPVYVGVAPKFEIEPAEAFRGAVLEVEAGGNILYLTLGTDVPVSSTEGRGTADLNAAPKLRGRFGRFRVRCQSPARPDHPPLVCRFVRLPQLGLEYVPDPVRPAAAAAVQITSNPALLADLVAGPETELAPAAADDAGLATLVLRSTAPYVSPAVTARAKPGGWEIRARVAVSRGCLLTARDGFGGWMPLPLPEIDLGQVGLDDRLRVEFHEPPVTEGGRLVSRLPGRGELLVGEPLDPAADPRAFQIDLHRWRDGFGIGTGGGVQIRGPRGWTDVAALAGAEGPSPPPPEPQPETWWQELSVGLDGAVRQGEGQSVPPLIGRCLEACDDANVPPCAADLLPLAAARAALANRPPTEWPPVRHSLDRLTERDDLPEAKLLAATMELRSGHRAGDDLGWSRTEELRDELPNTPGAAVVLAECWYNLARATIGSADGCWWSCSDLSDRYINSPVRETGLALSDAYLLRDLACL